MLIPSYEKKLLLFVHFLDNMIDIWINNGLHDNWMNFKKYVNDFGILEWDIKEHLNYVIF